MKDVIIELNSINMFYNYNTKNQYHVLKNINMNINNGEFIVILGQSGSGKSTLLNVITSNLSPTFGTRYYEGEIWDKDNENTIEWSYKNIGYVFQDFNLIDSLTVNENIAMGLALTNISKNNLNSLIKEYAKQLEIDHVLDKFPYECSGGELQRVAIAKALIKKPKLIVADEPTGNLDYQNTKKIIDIFKTMNQEGYTIIVVTHNVEIAKYADKVIYLRDGKIEKEINSNCKEIENFKREISCFYNDLLESY